MLRFCLHFSLFRAVQHVAWWLPPTAVTWVSGLSFPPLASTSWTHLGNVAAQQKEAQGSAWWDGGCVASGVFFLCCPCCRGARSHGAGTPCHIAQVVCDLGPHGLCRVWPPATCRLSSPVLVEQVFQWVYSSNLCSFVFMNVSTAHIISEVVITTHTHFIYIYMKAS